MPQRFLRPGITNSDAWNSVSFEAQSLYIRILTLVDDFGRYDGRVPILHGQCFALRPDIKPQRTAAFRSELHTAGLLAVYEVDGKEYIQITKWSERARGEKSKFPNPPPFTESADIPQESAAERSGTQQKDASIDHRPSPLHPRPSSLAITSDADASRETEPGQKVKLNEGFEEFWTIYPKKVGKADAQRAWTKYKCAEFFEKIIAAVKRAAQSLDWKKEAGQFIPHPATWLNRNGWEDEIRPAGALQGPREAIKLPIREP